jgi:hypothetical protein
MNTGPRPPVGGTVTGASPSTSLRQAAELAQHDYHGTFSASWTSLGHVVLHLGGITATERMLEQVIRRDDVTE